MTILRAALSLSTAQQFKLVHSKLVHSFHLFTLLPYSILLLKRSRNFPRNSALKNRFIFVWAGAGQSQEQSWWFCVQFCSILSVWSAFTLHIAHCPHLPIFKPCTVWSTSRTDLSLSETQSLCSASFQKFSCCCKACETASVLQIQFQKMKKEAAFPLWSWGNCG